MRIALVSQEYPPETAKGGIGSQTYLKAHGLTELGHEVHVLSRSTTNALSHSEDRGVRLTRIPGFEHRTAIHTDEADWLTYSAEVAGAVARLHEQHPLDLVEFPEWAAEGYVHLINRTEWNHIPTAIQLHGPLVMFAHTLGWPDLDSNHYRVGVQMEGTCVRLADAVFSSSRCSIDWCARHYGLDPGPVPVIHTGVDRSLFHPRKTARDSRPTIVFVGKITENKGVRHLVEAACLLAREIPDLRLQLVGRGSDQLIGELRQRALAEGLPELLDFKGFVAREDLPELLSGADVFAAPSAYEGGPGFVYLEAMACGLPVIACEGSGAAEVVEGRGLLVAPADVGGLTGVLRRVLTDETLRVSLGKRGLDYVAEHADSKRCIRRLAAFYEAVAAGKRWEEIV